MYVWKHSKPRIEDAAAAYNLTGVLTLTSIVRLLLPGMADSDGHRVGSSVLGNCLLDNDDSLIAWSF